MMACPMFVVSGVALSRTFSRSPDMIVRLVWVPRGPEWKSGPLGGGRFAKKLKGGMRLIPGALYAGDRKKAMFRRQVCRRYICLQMTRLLYLRA